MIRSASSKVPKAVAVFCALLLPMTAGFGQAPAPGPLLTPDQLDNLIAPVALYPDPLLGQVLAASTYPLEVIEAQQWRNQQGNLSGAALVDAAKQMNWDASVQALVAFPDALNLLSSDVQWATDLGNAFLAQQSDIMNAVQRMRARARANGRLQSSSQQIVTTDQDAIEIQPASPEVIYVPVYEPEYIWGPPVWGAYPDLWYPPGYGYGFGYGPAIYVSSYFPGWGGWGGWGWGVGWGGRSLFVNTGFYSRYGFRGGGRFDRGWVGGRDGRAAWSHDPGHRMNVPYPNRGVATRFNSNRFNSGGQASGTRSISGQFGGNRNRFSGGGNRTGTNAGASGGFNGDNRAGRQQTPNGGAGFAQTNRGTAGANAGGWRGFSGDNRSGRQQTPNSGAGPIGAGQSTRGFNGDNRPARQQAPNPGAGFAQSNGGAADGSRRGFRGDNRPAGGGSNNSPVGAAQPNRNFNASRPANNSFATPNRNIAPAPQATPRPAQGFRSAPSPSVQRNQNFAAPRSSQAPSRSFSSPGSAPAAPRSFSGGGSNAPRSFGGGQSRGSSGGGHQGGGGGGGGRHR